MDKNPHKGHRSRLRDRARKDGIENFQDYQVLEYALSFVVPYKDTNPIAHELIDKFGSLANVLEANEEDIANVKGMGEVSAHFLTAIIPIYNFYERQRSSRIGEISSPQQAFEYVKGLFSGKLIEELYMVSLLPNNKILKCEKIAEGTVGQAKVTIRKMTDSISRNKVNNVIIAHNHPSGLCAPSADDDKLTKALVTTLAINDTFLMDHVIIGENGFYSYRQSGAIDKYKSEVATLLHSKASIIEAKYDYDITESEPIEVDYDQK